MEWYSEPWEDVALQKGCESRVSAETEPGIQYVLYVFWWVSQNSLAKPHAKSLQSCLTVCDSVDYNPPGSSLHGIFHARILGWVAVSLSRESSCPKDWICLCVMSPGLAGRFFTTSATWEDQQNHIKGLSRFATLKVFHGTQYRALPASLYWWLATESEKENRGCMAVGLYGYGVWASWEDLWVGVSSQLPLWVSYSWSSTQPTSFTCVLSEETSFP